jgi:hypothetical protein
MYLLLKNPEAMKKAIAEVDSVLTGSQRVPEYNQISQFPYLAQCVKANPFLFESVLGLVLGLGFLLECGTVWHRLGRGRVFESTG